MREAPRTDSDIAALLNDALWVDLLDPTREEEKVVERLLGVDISTREEMAEIEESSCLYENLGAMVMTAVVVTGIAEHRGGPLCAHARNPGDAAVRRSLAFPYLRGEMPPRSQRAR